MPLGGAIITTCCTCIIINKQTDAFINPVPKPLHHAYLRVRLQIELIDPSDGCATSDHLQRLVIHADEEQRFPDAHVQEGSCAYIVQGLGYRVQGLWYRVQGLGIRVQGLGLRIRISGIGFRVSGLRVQCLFSVNLRIVSFCSILSCSYPIAEHWNNPFCYKLFYPILSYILSWNIANRICIPYPYPYPILILIMPWNMEHVNSFHLLS